MMQANLTEFLPHLMTTKTSTFDAIIIIITTFIIIN